MPHRDPRMAPGTVEILDGAWYPRKEDRPCCAAKRDSLGRYPIGFCGPDCIARLTRLLSRKADRPDNRGMNTATASELDRQVRLHDEARRMFLQSTAIHPEWDVEDHKDFIDSELCDVTTPVTALGTNAGPQTHPLAGFIETWGRSLR